MPSIGRLDRWVGPRMSSKPKKLDRRLSAIKPKNCRILVKSSKQVEARHGKYTSGVAFPGSKVRTIVVKPNIEKEEIAHEFGHAAFRHPWGTRRSTVGVYIRNELAAWQWAVDHWAKPNNIKTGVISQRKQWLYIVMGQAMQELYLPVGDILAITKEQMKVLKMKPIADTEMKWLRREMEWLRKLIAKEAVKKDYMEEKE